MADAEEKAKAEKIAAAKKRVELMMKKKGKKVDVKKEDKYKPALESSQNTDKTPEATEHKTSDNPNETKEVDGEDGKDVEETIAELKTSPYQRQPSLSVQSKMRSSSFRQTSASGGPLSPSYGFPPEGDTAPNIHRKQAAKIEELEMENKRLAKEASDGEKRWKKAEDELDDLLESEYDSNSNNNNQFTTSESVAELEKLKSQITALRRQNDQLQAQSLRSTRHGSVSTTTPTAYESVLASKSSTIESMEITISNLRAELSKSGSSTSEKEQITALEEKLARSDRSSKIAQQELGDLKKNLERTTEKAVKEGGERISAETELRTLEREAAEAKTYNEELQKKVDALEKKVATLSTLHKEQDARSQAQKRAREKAEKEASDLRSKLASIENENLRLKEERERLRKRDAQGVDDEGVDELENEERQRLEKKVRDLEGEVHELRRGVWRERRKEFEGDESPGVTSPGARFTDVDLGGFSPSRRRSLAPSTNKVLGDFFTSGFNAITGANKPGAGGEALLENDEDMEFDEDAFRAAQEEEAKKRMERAKEVKRGLKNWEGWRLDLVENRRGGGEGVGEIFEV